MPPLAEVDHGHVLAEEPPRVEGGLAALVAVAALQRAAAREAAAEELVDAVDVLAQAAAAGEGPTALLDIGKR